MCRRAVLLLISASCLVVGHGAEASCGALFQRMQVGALPDVFLNSIDELPTGGEWLGPTPPAPPIRRRVSEKVVDLSWTSNLALSPSGDCNVHARVDIEGVGVFEYAVGCDARVTPRPAHCEVVLYPNAATVSGAIADRDVARRAVRLAATDRARWGAMGAVSFFGISCSGDICVRPRCLEERTPNNRDCDRFDPDAEGWRSSSPWGERVYLIGRGNVYVGQRVAPSFLLTAPAAADTLPIDHWIANGNDRAVVLVAQSASAGTAIRRFGALYRADRWHAVALDGRPIERGTTLHVHVMADRGPGRQFAARAAIDATLELDDPMINRNPNAMVIASVQLADKCTADPRGGRSCRPEPFDHAIGVRYDALRGRWSVVAEDGAHFEPKLKIHAFMAGLPGSYGADFPMYVRPESRGRLEILDIGAPTALTARSGSILFATHAGATAFSAPAALAFVDGAWTIATEGGPLREPRRFNVWSPLGAR